MFYFKPFVFICNQIVLSYASLVITNVHRPTQANRPKLTSFRLSLVADVRVLVAHTDHNSGVFRAANDGRKHSSRCVISSKSSLDEVTISYDFVLGNGSYINKYVV